jgi:selenocysteine lyase/cysteine desulfurase
MLDSRGIAVRTGHHCAQPDGTIRNWRNGKASCCL